MSSRIKYFSPLCPLLIMHSLNNVFFFKGLANLYDKTDQWDFKVELPNVYQKLVELYAR